jgi:hypothetical protein
VPRASLARVSVAGTAAQAPSTAGARPTFTRSHPGTLGLSRAHSSAGERPLHTREVAGSIPAAPMEKPPLSGRFHFRSGRRLKPEQLKPAHAGIPDRLPILSGLGARLSWLAVGGVAIVIAVAAVDWLRSSDGESSGDGRAQRSPTTLAEDVSTSTEPDVCHLGNDCWPRDVAEAAGFVVFAPTVMEGSHAAWVVAREPQATRYTFWVTLGGEVGMKRAGFRVVGKAGSTRVWSDGVRLGWPLRGGTAWAWVMPLPLLPPRLKDLSSLVFVSTRSAEPRS